MKEASQAYSNSANSEVLECLQVALTALISLSHRAQEAHWNVKGASFGPLHELFGDFYAFLADSSDLVAERIVQLKGQAVASSCEGGLFGDEQTLLTSLMQLGTGLAEELKAGIILFNEELDDQVTGDILIEIARELDKWIWKIEAHTQKIVQVN